VNKESCYEGAGARVVIRNLEHGFDPDSDRMCNSKGYYYQGGGLLAVVDRVIDFKEGKVSDVFRAIGCDSCEMDDKGVMSVFWKGGEVLATVKCRGGELFLEWWCHK
jgi:hypothetical protein